MYRPKGGGEVFPGFAIQQVHPHKGMKQVQTGVEGLRVVHLYAQG